MKGDPTLADWIRQGLALHRDRKTERCQFCEQPLSKDRLTALETHFSTEYERFIRRIDQKIDKLDAASKASETLRLPTKADLYDDLGQELQSPETGLM